MSRPLRLSVLVVMMVMGFQPLSWAGSHHHTHSRRYAPHHALHRAQPIATINSVDSSLACLSSVVYHEARGEQPAEKIAVARVVLNRTVTDGFRPTVCGVVAETDYRYPNRKGRIFQFPWFHDRLQRQIRDMDAYRDSVDAARQALALHEQYGPTASLYFNSTPRGFDHTHYIVTQHEGHMWFFTARKKTSLS